MATMVVPATQTATAALRAPATSAPDRSTDAENRTAIDAAQAALMQGDVQTARAALARVKGKAVFRGARGAGTEHRGVPGWRAVGGRVREGGRLGGGSE